MLQTIGRIRLERDRVAHESRLIMSERDQVLKEIEMAQEKADLISQQFETAEKQKKDALDEVRTGVLSRDRREGWVVEGGEVGRTSKCVSHQCHIDTSDQSFPVLGKTEIIFCLGQMMSCLKCSSPPTFLSGQLWVPGTATCRKYIASILHEHEEI